MNDYKKLFTLTLLCLSLVSIGCQSDHSPVAENEKSVSCGNDANSRDCKFEKIESDRQSCKSETSEESCLQYAKKSVYYKSLCEKYPDSDNCTSYKQFFNIEATNDWYERDLWLTDRYGDDYWDAVVDDAVIDSIDDAVIDDVIPSGNDSYDSDSFRGDNYDYGRNGRILQ